jgi:hypothetical protein
MMATELAETKELAMSWYLIVMLGLVAESIVREQRSSRAAVASLQPLLVPEAASRPFLRSVPSVRRSR